ncbi:GNAT family N-acetyltransferase [Kineosporia succinea]|uniref:Ribosomal protein S18 acetylase RimI-like enzyme n=1 Tax=Kineosporia succinea TaxID=84632 RepID=A0ABT9PCX3_9ACTN|nr:GNAT family N-acetyltransferase [Kineosporia succinea]MDP9830556.1 ribosomal protein S18 acetylase RimI-like enzyme [Kineosporia succinea]
MTWQTGKSVPELIGAAEGLWAQDPAVNTILLTLTSNAQAPHTGGWWSETDGTVTGSYLRSTIETVLLGAMPAGVARVLAAHLADVRVRAVQGPRESVEEFSAVRERVTGARRDRQIAMALHRLGTLTPPRPRPAGSPRPAGPHDRTLLLGWFDAFGRETHTPVDLPAAVDDRLASGSLLIWEHDGRPVSLAGSTGPHRGSSRIISVYTPPALRGNGFAGGVVTASVEAALARGAAGVVLFTDLDNPTSNALYRRLGFERAGDFLQVQYDS